MDYVNSLYSQLHSMRPRQLLHQGINFGLIICSALMIWKSLMVVTGSESPIVVVLSGSMEPAFHRGDLLFLSQSEAEFNVGEIVVYKLQGKEIPIVHRVLRVHEQEDGQVEILTKGDNNNADDRGLFARGQLWLRRPDIVGRVKGFLPHVGMLTILMNDYPQ
eukprot:CAMPEP_0170748154 /NCGR_PEP_ID=MMETSP0437-20130122/9700_1 /TAXON_ID=0 /ORGANISM="Sexangularia sp." /LENGTH=161 /DNA_ID=CAMNT_0011086971 /DNA_START=19 /DNA_END=501 /DNA_ORIENTATION=-